MLLLLIVLKREVVIKVWIMFNFTVVRMLLVVTEKGTFSSLCLSSLEFFQCKIWVNLPLSKKCNPCKIKAEDLEAWTALDRKWLISFINETTTSTVLTLQETKLNNISKCSICSNSKVSTSNSALTINLSINCFKAVTVLSLSHPSTPIQTFWAKLTPQQPIKAFKFRMGNEEVQTKGVLYTLGLLRSRRTISLKLKDLQVGTKNHLKIWVLISSLRVHLLVEAEWAGRRTSSLYLATLSVVVWLV